MEDRNMPIEEEILENKIFELYNRGIIEKKDVNFLSKLSLKDRFSKFKSFIYNYTRDLYDDGYPENYCKVFENIYDEICEAMNMYLESPISKRESKIKIFKRESGFKWQR